MSSVATDEAVTIRTEPCPADVAAIRRIVQSTGYFHAFEVDVAVELIEERLRRGEASGYHFVFADLGSETIGYACYGPIACTTGSFDLFWIAVDAAHQGRGLGRQLMRESEVRIAAAGGRRIYIETSNRPQYAPTRTFYERCGYLCEAILKDFYDVADDKAIYVRACVAG